MPDSYQEDLLLRLLNNNPIIEHGRSKSYSEDLLEQLVLLGLNNVISATYAELQELVNNNALKVGATYLLTDFCTKYNQPVTNDLKTEAIEPLLLTAIATNKFHNECKSTVYAFDIVYYDFNDNICEDGETERNGRITGRWDLENNNKLIGNDWRTIKYKRYTIDDEATGVIAWVDEDLSFVVGDLVSYNNNLYACIIPITGALPTDPEFILLFENYATLPICLDTSGNLTKVYIKTVEKTLVGGGTGTDFLFFNGTGTLKNNNLNLNNSDNETYYNNTVFINSNLLNNELLSGSEFGYNTIIDSQINYNSLIGSGIYNNTIISSQINYNFFTCSLIYNKILTGSQINNNTLKGSNIHNNTLKGSQINNNTLTVSNISNNALTSSSINNNTLTGSQIYNNTLNNKQFRFNNLINISVIDFTLATHVFVNYYCELAKNSGDVAYLRYCDADNVYQIVLPTE